MTATGKVGMLVASASVVNIHLADLPPDQTPRSEENGFQCFRLSNDHRNYNGFYSIGLVAATNRNALQIRVVQISGADVQIAEQIGPEVGWMRLRFE